MKIKPIHPNFKMPSKGSPYAAAYDLFMPQAGRIVAGSPHALKIPLGFAAELPPATVALLLPRSGKGVSYGLELNNTCGVIDEDYRGEWMVALRLKNPEAMLTWEAGEKLFQMLLMPVYSPEMEIVDQLSETARGTGGFGSTGA
jgi:dUTP pyrophosphatase